MKEDERFREDATLEKYERKKCCKYYNFNDFIFYKFSDDIQL
jgi:hypothetical protein